MYNGTSPGLGTEKKVVKTENRLEREDVFSDDILENSR